MKLNQYTDYSLRVLIYLAVKEKETDSLSTIRQISEIYNVSKNHLVKVVHRLSTLSYLTTTTGKTGGIRLAKKPSEINIGQIIREMESSMDIVECFNRTDQPCIITGNCFLTGVLKNALKAFMDELSKYTLEDLIKNQGILTSKFKK